MYSVRRWSVRHARLLESIYLITESLLFMFQPLFKWMGYHRLERPVAFVERLSKGLLFDCNMCGSCVLSQTGMSCPMNCPKTLRNGPCGGVRAGGMCEVDAAMTCVWVEAFKGQRRMRNPQGLIDLQQVVKYTRKGQSSWLHYIREQCDPEVQNQK
jgi:methylene-tetrahydrofolate reductase-like protein